MTVPSSFDADPLYKVFVWDLEATGLNKREDRIIQIAIYESNVTPKNATTPAKSEIETLSEDEMLEVLTATLETTHLSNGNTRAIVPSRATITEVCAVKETAVATGDGVSYARKNGIKLTVTENGEQGFLPRAEENRQTTKAEKESRADSGGLCPFFDSYVNPGVKIKNSHIHKITNQMVGSYPSFSVVWEKVVVFIEERTPSGRVPLLVAHNGISYDERLLVHELDRHDTEVPVNWRFADSLMLCRQVYPDLANANGRRSHSMDTVTWALGVTNQMAHNALGDVTALNEVLMHISRDIVPNCKMTIHQWAASNAHVLPSIQSEPTTPQREVSSATTTPARRTRMVKTPSTPATPIETEIAQNGISIADSGMGLTPTGANRKNGNSSTPIRKKTIPKSAGIATPAPAPTSVHDTDDQEPMNEKKGILETEGTNIGVVLSVRFETNTALGESAANQNGAVVSSGQTIGQGSPNCPIVINPPNMLVPATPTAAANMALNSRSDSNPPIIGVPGVMVLQANILVYGVGWVRRCQAIARSTGMQCRLAAENGDACAHNSHIYQLYVSPTQPAMLIRPAAVNQPRL